MLGQAKRGPNAIRGLGKGCWVFAHARPNDPRAPDGLTIFAPPEQYGPEHFPGLTTGDTSTGPALYDLSTDPAEQKNVAAEHPDVVRRLQEQFDKMAAEVAASMKP
jgi:hypothetical protein